MVPFYSGVQAIKKHAQDYPMKWQHKMDAVFGSSGNTVDAPTPFNRSNFYLCDNLPYEKIEIAEGIHGEHLLTEISPSRVLSFSLFIDPLVQLKSDLCLDQRIELGFVCCFLSSPFWFDKTMTDLIDKHRDGRLGITLYAWRISYNCVELWYMLWMEDGNQISALAPHHKNQIHCIDHLIQVSRDC
jgi:hypothetical protein